MNVPLEFDLGAYHTQAVAAIAAHFGADISAVAAYPRFNDKIPAVAITLELDGITPESPDDLGTEQFHANIRFVAYVFVSVLADDPKLKVRKLAARLVAFLYGKRFACPVGPAKILAASPDDLTLPGKSAGDATADDYEVWRVEWSHEALLGQSVWNDDPVLPVEVWTNAEAIEDPAGDPYTDESPEPYFTGGERLA